MDMEEADRVPLERLPLRLVILRLAGVRFHVFAGTDAMASVSNAGSRAEEHRDRHPAEQCVPPKGDDHRLLLVDQNR